MPDSIPASVDDATLLRDRYGTALPDAGKLNAVLRSLLSHRSVRAYLPTALPPGTLQTLVAAAQSAATSSNLQAWSVLVVEDAGRRGRLAAIAAGQAHIRQCPLFLVWLADLSRLDRVGAAQGSPMEGLHYLETFIVAVVDAALAAQNAVVALESLGMSSVFIGALRNNPEAVAAELGLPPHVMAVFGLCVGYADPSVAAAVKPRLPQAAVLHREQYGAPDEAAVIAEYDAALGEFSTEHNMAEHDWTGRVVGRVGTTAALRGRDRMRAALRALGWELR